MGKINFKAFCENVNTKIKNAQLDDGQTLDVQNKLIRIFANANYYDSDVENLCEEEQKIADEYVNEAIENAKKKKNYSKTNKRK